MQKKSTSFRLMPENEAKLKALAKRDNLNSSQIINKLISEYSVSREEKETKPSVMPKEVENYLNKLEKELSLQRQRINILKTQIDYLLKSQDGKGRLDKYTEHSKST